MEQSSKAATTASSSKRTSKDPGKDPPPLSSADALLLKSVGESVEQMLAEKMIDTNVYSAAGEDEAQSHLKENAQNVRNRGREVLFKNHIQK